MAYASANQNLDLSHLSLYESRHAVLAASRHPSETDTVLRVRLRRIPPQVGKSVVRPIRVWGMTRFHTVRARADEGFENEAMDEFAVSIAVII